MVQKSNQNIHQYELALDFSFHLSLILCAATAPAVKEEDKDGGAAVKPPLKRYSSTTDLLSSLSWDRWNQAVFDNPKHDQMDSSVCLICGFDF